MFASPYAVTGNAHAIALNFPPSATQMNISQLLKGVGKLKLLVL